ncbi:MAG: PQQ-binding-like beta-propeller repeat protein, partial [Acidobacteria bacterium]|nr:PQQ-binding-like beta-propeller repeat protein [Acidobacteriota bacterium]
RGRAGPVCPGGGPRGGRRGRRGRGGGRGAQEIRRHQFVVMAFDRETGDVAWRRVAREAVPHEGYQQPNGTYASGSAVTDGERLYAFFGSWGLYAYDLDGELLWETDLGTRFMRNAFGEGTTPALHGDTLVVTWDHIGGQSFVAALDARTGRERWRSNRDEIDTWATPLVVEHEGRAQVVTPAMDQVYGYDLETGETIWRSRGTTMNAIPSPVHAAGIVYVTSGYRGNNLQAIRLADARGDVAGTGAVLWQLDRDTPYVPSPLLYDDALYLLKSNDGILSAFDPLTGEPHYALQRLAGVPNIFASPVGAAGRVYIAGRTAPPSSSATAPATRCSPPTPSTTASTPRRPSSTTSCTCAATGISTRSRRGRGRAETAMTHGDGATLHPCEPRSP